MIDVSSVRLLYAGDDDIEMHDASAVDSLSAANRHASDTAAPHSPCSSEHATAPKRRRSCRTLEASAFTEDDHEPSEAPPDGPGALSAPQPRHSVYQSNHLLPGPVMGRPDSPHIQFRNRSEMFALLAGCSAGVNTFGVYSGGKPLQLAIMNCWSDCTAVCRAPHWRSCLTVLWCASSHLCAKCTRHGPGA